MENEVKYATEKQISKRTGRPLSTLRNHRFLKRGFPYIKCGRSIRYSISDIDEYMEKHKVRTEE